MLRMRTPILVVDDDPAVLKSLRRDLIQRYGDRYRIVASLSVREGLELLDHFYRQNTPPALLISDQKMRQMGGERFLELAGRRFPGVRRALFAAQDEGPEPGDPEGLHAPCRLEKPWQPPQTRLYPVLDRLLQVQITEVLEND